MWQAIGAGISAIGSLFGGRKSQKSAESQARRQEQLQREFAQHGIRWRVEDAKAAGLHPLYALGAQTPQYSPVLASDSMGPAIADAGQSIGRAVAATSTAAEKRVQELNIRALENQVEEGDLRNQWLRSKVLLDQPAGLQAFPVDDSHMDPDAIMIPGPDAPPVNQSNMDFFDSGTAGVRLPTGREHRPGDRSLNFGRFPMWTEFNVTHGPDPLRMVLPGGISGDPAEALESLAESIPLMWMTYQENVARYGEPLADKIFSRYFGQQWQRFKEDIKSQAKDVLNPFN